MDDALFRFFQQDKHLITDYRPLRMRLAHPAKMLEDVMLPARVYGTEAICGGVEYHILCVSYDAHIPLKELIALPVAVDIVTDRGQLRSVCGIVTEALAGDSDGGLASYQLVLRDALAIMEKRVNSRIFRRKNEVEIVRLILNEWCQSNLILGGCFHQDTTALYREDQYPAREFTMQYNESDAAFIRRLLRRRGISWHFRAEKDDYPAHTMVLFNNSAALPVSSAGLVRFHREAATEERDTITAWNALRTLQAGKVTRFSWNYHSPFSRDFMTVDSDARADQGRYGNVMAASLDDYQVLAPHAGDNHQDLCRLGELAMARHDFESKCFHGEGNVRDLCVGECFGLGGHPEIDLHQDADREFILTSLQIAATNNLPNGLIDRVEQMFSRNRWLQRAEHLPFEPSALNARFRINFTAVRRNIPIVPAYDARVDMPNVPMQSAKVVGPPDEEVYCDRLGRVKIRFHHTRQADHAHASGAGTTNNEVDSAWVRVASNWAGNVPGGIGQCGNLHLPRVGSEVLVAFVGGDADKPVIVGQMYNENAVPPALSGRDALPASRYVSGLKSREYKHGRSNRLRFDDTSDEISVQVASDHADAQLNLGFFTEPRLHGEGKPRGEGAELRTDGHVAVRGGSGLLLSGWRASDGPSLARGDMIRIQDECAELARAIGDLAGKCHALQIERAAIDELINAIKDWEAGTNTQPKAAGTPQPCVGITAPAGISLVTPKAIAHYAGSDLEAGAQGQVSLAAGKRACVNAGGGVSLFAQSGGLTAIAQQGEVLVQSQGGGTEINAAKQLLLTASEGKVMAMAKEIVLIAEDGSFIKIGGGITLGTNGVITHHGTSFPFKGPSKMNAELPKFEQGKTEIKFQGRYYADRGEDSIPAVDAHVEIESTDGTQRKERSDAEGNTAILSSDAMHSASASVFGNKDGGNS